MSISTCSAKLILELQANIDTVNGFHQHLTTIIWKQGYVYPCLQASNTLLIYITVLSIVKDTDQLNNA